MYRTGSMPLVSGLPATSRIDPLGAVMADRRSFSLVISTTTLSRGNTAATSGATSGAPSPLVPGTQAIDAVNTSASIAQDSETTSQSMSIDSFAVALSTNASANVAESTDTTPDLSTSTLILSSNAFYPDFRDDRSTGIFDTATSAHLGAIPSFMSSQATTLPMAPKFNMPSTFGTGMTNENAAISLDAAPQPTSVGEGGKASMSTSSSTAHGVPQTTADLPVATLFAAGGSTLAQVIGIVAA